MTIHKTNKITLMLSTLTIALSINVMASQVGNPTEPSNTAALSSMHTKNKNSEDQLNVALEKYKKFLVDMKQKKPSVISRVFNRAKKDSYNNDLAKKQPILDDFKNLYNTIADPSQKKIADTQEAEQILQKAMGLKARFSIPPESTGVAIIQLNSNGKKYLPTFVESGQKAKEKMTPLSPVISPQAASGATPLVDSKRLDALVDMYKKKVSSTTIPFNTWVDSLTIPEQKALYNKVKDMPLIGDQGHSNLDDLKLKSEAEEKSENQQTLYP